MMLPSNNIQSIIGATMFGADKVKLGRIDQVLVDAEDGHPTWAEVHTGVFGRHTTFVPLDEATWENDDVYVPHDKELVKSAPEVDGEEGLTPDQERDLNRHYAGAEGRKEMSEPARTSYSEETEGADDDTPEQHLDEAGVIWEERVVVSKEKVPVAKVHLETTTVTEDQEVTVDVQKEKVVLEEDQSPDQP